VRSVTSNAGHVLWAGAADPDKARSTAQRLLQPDMFSGWGVRTLSRKSPRYNPQGYHLGSIWPHDNSLLAMGFKRYDLAAELSVLATALFEAAKTFQYYRLPELFAGSSKTAHQTPVPYPVACRPQAWAAGAIPLITQAVLGLCPDAVNRRLFIVEPSLPPFLDRADVTGLRVGEAEVDLAYGRRGHRTYVMVKDVRGDVDVQEVSEWPEALR
jgi:glycogen debranching enzyme